MRLPALRLQPDVDRQRLSSWSGDLRARLLGTTGLHATRVGELAAGSPYEPFTLEAYLKAGGHPAVEPLILSLTRFDCVTLVEACLAVARVAAAPGEPTWERFAAEVERMRYRGGTRRGYTSRLHYFTEWLRDGESRGLVRNLGAELGGEVDARPLRFMTEHRSSYPALADDGVFKEIGRTGAEPRCCSPGGWYL